MSIDYIEAILMAGVFIGAGIIAGVLIFHQHIQSATGTLWQELTERKHYQKEWELHLKLIKNAYNLDELLAVRNSIIKKAERVRYDHRLDDIDHAFRARLKQINQKLPEAANHEPI